MSATKIRKAQGSEKKAQLEARKRRTIMESPTQSPLRSSPDLTPEKTIPPEKAMPSSTSSATASQAVESTPPSVRKNSFFCFCMDQCNSNTYSFSLLGSDQCCLTGTAGNQMVLQIQASQLQYPIPSNKHLPSGHQPPDDLLPLDQRLCSPFCCGEGFTPP